ncbi:MAG TPA: energy transducer TonB [Pyrinomonadaceae bacterium]|jgi:protein TonB
MFNKLIESSSHTREIKRRGSFFLGTLVFYIALLGVAGVGSIYAYNVELGDGQEMDVVVMMRFPPVQAITKPQERRNIVQPANRGGGNKMQSVMRTGISIQTPYLKNRGMAKADVPEVTARMLPNVELGATNSPPGDIGPPSDGKNGGGDGNNLTGNNREPRTPVDEVVPERVPKKETTPPTEPTPQKPRVITSSLLNGKAIQKPAPVYPKIAKEAKAQGTVTVQILVDEQGRVISAQATNGHPLLKKAAVEAAYQARFSQTILNGQAVRVSGVITYNFMLQ